MAGLKRFIILLILLLLSFFLQSVILPRIPGLTSVPNLMLISVISAGFLSFIFRSGIVNCPQVGGKSFHVF